MGPRCKMPYVPPQLMHVITLYNRCRANKCLPRAGGLLDQPAWLMELFGVIDSRREDKARLDRDNLAAKDGLRGNRG